jgi:hypothetical protein
MTWLAALATLEAGKFALAGRRDAQPVSAMKNAYVSPTKPSDKYASPENLRIDSPQLRSEKHRS